MKKKLILLDNPSKSGISTHGSSKKPNDYSVSYKNINIFDDIDEKSSADGAVSLTRAYTNPQNGVQSIAFLNSVTVLDETSGELKEALLMRVESVSVIEDKLIFLNGEYEKMEISLINKDGEYLVHGKSLKNSNFFEYYKSYNDVDIAVYKKITEMITSETGIMRLYNSKKRKWENENDRKEIEGLSLHVVHTLADAIDAKDAYTKGHSGRVAEYAREIAKRAGYSYDRQEEIYMMEDVDYKLHEQ